MNISQIDLEELVANWAGIDINQSDDFEQELDNWLIENYDVDFENFTCLMNLVFKGLDFSISPITNKPFIGITGDSQWLVKKEFPESSLISIIVQWISSGEAIKEGKNGHHRTITASGKPEFDLYLVKPGLKASFKKE